jgi:osmotically-inducible protein OsmY
MWNDTDLQHYVERELEWEPSVHQRQIGVTVKNGAVHLDGHVESYWEKCAAEAAAWRIAHIKSVANEIRVTLPFDAQRDDDDLALAAMAVLEANCLVPATVEVQVSGGCVTLAGRVEWHYQREAAESALRPLKGVGGLRNDIAVRPTAPAGDVKANVEEACKRSALVDSSRIKVHLAQDSISLRGVARTHAEHQAALLIARSTPGVARVEDHVSIG